MRGAKFCRQRQHCWAWQTDSTHPGRIHIRGVWWTWFHHTGWKQTTITFKHWMSHDGWRVSDVVIVGTLFTWAIYTQGQLLSWSSLIICFEQAILVLLLYIYIYINTEFVLNRLFLYSCSKPERPPVGDHSCTTGNRSRNLCYTWLVVHFYKLWQISCLTRWGSSTFAPRARAGGDSMRTDAQFRMCVGLWIRRVWIPCHAHKHCDSDLFWPINRSVLS